MIAHTRIHARDKSIRPAECDSLSFASNKLKERVIIKHIGDKPRKGEYPDCKKTFCQKKELNEHIEVCSGNRPYPCRVEGCGKCFKQHSHRGKHELRIHGAKGMHQCAKCEKSFAARCDLSAHVKRVHFICGPKEPVVQVDSEYVFPDCLATPEPADLDQSLTPEISVQPKPRKRQRVGRVAKTLEVVGLDMPVEQQECMVCGYLCGTAQEVLVHVKAAHPMSMELL